MKTLGISKGFIHLLLIWFIVHAVAYGLGDYFGDTTEQVHDNITRMYLVFILYILLSNKYEKGNE